MKQSRIFFFITVLIFASNVYAQDITQLGPDIDGEIENGSFGTSVDISSDGNIIAVGGASNCFSCPDFGRARIFEWNGNFWEQLGEDIVATEAEDLFGRNTKLSGDGTRILVSAYDNDGEAENAGQLRTYEWNGIAWNQIGEEIDGNGPNEQFGGGAAISSDGNRIAASARPSSEEPGVVRIYQWQVFDWVQVGEDLVGDTPNDLFGYSIDFSADGNTIGIGARSNSENGNFSGETKVYEWNGDSWIQKGNDIDGGSEYGDYFGTSLSLSSDGNVLAVSASEQQTIDSERRGFTKVYEWNGSSWGQRGSVLLGEDDFDRSGNSISLSGDGNTLAIGCNNNDGPAGTNSGHIRVYSWDGISWNQIEADIDGDEEGDNFGISVALNSSGSRLVGGAFAAESNNISTGHARAFSLCTITSSVDAQTACDSYEWIDGNTYFEDNNSASFALENADGCDSIVTLDLTINNSSSSSTSVTSCNSYEWNGNIYGQSGTYNTILTNQVGCDSVAALNLDIIDGPDNTVVIEDGVLIAQETGVTYQWLDCEDDFAIIEGATNQFYAPAVSGSYAVELTDDECSVISACTQVSILGVENENNVGARLYPNPNNGVFIIESLANDQIINWTLLDATGKLLLSEKVSSGGSTIEMDISVEKGVYLLRIELESGSIITRRVQIN
jgi:hypothetical protein